MPVYEYVCTSCQHEFEELARSMADRGRVRCPACQSEKAKRKLSVFSARQGAASSKGASSDGSCTRCGDPQGPCSF